MNLLACAGTPYKAAISKLEKARGMHCSPSTFWGGGNVLSESPSSTKLRDCRCVVGSCAKVFQASKRCTFRDAVRLPWSGAVLIAHLMVATFLAHTLGGMFPPREFTFLFFSGASRYNSSTIAIVDRCLARHVHKPNSRLLQLVISDLRTAAKADEFVPSVAFRPKGMQELAGSDGGSFSFSENRKRPKD